MWTGLKEKKEAFVLQQSKNAKEIYWFYFFLQKTGKRYNQIIKFLKLLLRDDIISHLTIFLHYAVSVMLCKRKIRTIGRVVWP